MECEIVLNADKPVGPNGLKGNISIDKNVTGVQGPDSTGAELFEKINAARAAAGVAPLVRCGPLDQVATEHVFDMNYNQYFDHTDISGKSPLFRVQNAGYQIKTTPIKVGQVIAWDRNTPQIALDTWMASSDNKAVLLDHAFVDVGIASYQGASLAYLRQGLPNWDKVWFWCVVLGVGGLCQGNTLYSSQYSTSTAQPFATTGPVCFTDADGFQACFNPPGMV